MTEAEIAKLATWLAKAGLEGRSRNRAGRGLLQPRGRRRIAARARDGAHRHAPPHSRGAGVSLGKGKAGSDADRIRANRRRGGGRTLADKPSLPALDERRIAVAPACDRGDRSRISFLRGVSRGEVHGLCRDHQPLRRRRRDRRDGLRLFLLDDGSSRRIHRRGARRAEAAHALPRACDQSRLSRSHRRDAGRDLSRSRRRPAGVARPHRARASPTGSTRCCGSAICATIRASPTPRRRRRSFRCSTTMPRPSSRRSTSMPATC